MKLNRTELRKLINETIEMLYEEESEKIKVGVRGTSFSVKPSTNKELNLQIPIGFKKIMFYADKAFSVSGKDSGSVQGEHRLTVPNVGSTYYLTTDWSGTIKVKPVR